MITSFSQLATAMGPIEGVKAKIHNELFAVLTKSSCTIYRPECISSNLTMVFSFFGKYLFADIAFSKTNTDFQIPDSLRITWGHLVMDKLTGSVQAYYSYITTIIRLSGYSDQEIEVDRKPVSATDYKWLEAYAKENLLKLYLAQ